MNEQYYTAFRWACKNEIRVYPEPKDGQFILILERDGKKQTSGKLYPKKDYQKVIWEFYLTLYNNRKND